MLEKLRIREGDELEVEVEDGNVVAVRPLKLVPTDFFSAGMLRKLEERSRSMDAGHKAHEPEITAATALGSRPSGGRNTAKADEDAISSALAREAVPERTITIRSAGGD